MADSVAEYLKELATKPTPNNETAAAVTLTAGQSGQVFTNFGAAAEVVFTLPAADSGLKFAFVVQDTNGIKLDAIGSDTIRQGPNVSAASGTAESIVIGSSITIYAVNDTQWIVIASEHTAWTIT